MTGMDNGYGPDDRCPRCGVLIRGMPGYSRITDDRDIAICGLCASEEAMFQARYPGQPLPPITEEIPLDPEGWAR